MGDTALSVELSDATIQRLADAVADRWEARFRHREDSQDRWLNTKEAAAYLGLSVSAVHRLTASRKVPFEQERSGCKCWFRRSDLDAWRRDG